MAYTEEALRSLVGDYDEGKRQLLDRRDQRIRDFHAAGWRPVDLQRITGYSRETIRHALHPDVRQATNAGRRKPARPEAASRIEPRLTQRPEPRLVARPGGSDHRRRQIDANQAGGRVDEGGRCGVLVALQGRQDACRTSPCGEPLQ